MSTRRGFFAFVGGALVTGGVSVGQIARPRLILPDPLIGGTRPPSFGLADLGQPSGRPLLDAVFAKGESQMHAFLDVRKGLSDDAFNAWLEMGLRASVDNMQRGVGA